MSDRKCNIINEFKGEITNNFTQIPNDIFWDKEISLRARGLFCFLLYEAGTKSFQFEPGCTSTLVKEGRSAVRSALKELVDSNYVTIEDGRYKGQFANNKYHLHLPKRTANEAASDEGFVSAE